MATVDDMEAAALRISVLRQRPTEETLLRLFVMLRRGFEFNDASALADDKHADLTNVWAFEEINFTQVTA